MNKRILRKIASASLAMTVLLLAMTADAIAQSWGPTQVPQYNPDSRRSTQRALHVGETFHAPAGGAPALGTNGWTGSGALFTDSVNVAFYYYVRGIFRNLGEAACNDFIDKPQVTYTGTPFHFKLSDSVRFNIDCRRYIADSVTLVFDQGDTLGRRDVIYADTSGYHIKKGTPSETPERPTLSAGQLFVTDLFIPAFDSLGTGISTIIVYDENDATVTNSGTTSAANATAFPWLGTYHIRITTINNGDYWEITKTSGTWDISEIKSLGFWIKLRAQMPQLANLRASLWVGSTQVSQFEPTVGFDKNNQTTYQNVGIEMSAFGTLANTNINKIRFRYTSNNATNYTGFDQDFVHFIEGIGQPSSGGGVNSVDIGINGTALGITGPSTGAVTKTFSWLGSGSQLVTGAGSLITNNYFNTVGTFGSLASDARGANVSSNTIAFQPVTATHPGMTTSAMKAAWDSANARTAENLGAYDTIAVYIDGLRTGFKSLKDSTGIGIIDRGDYLAIYATGGGGGSPALSGEGTTVSNDSVHIGGAIGAASAFFTERTINTNRKILHLTNGVASEAGGALWQFSNRPYSPFQFISQDTIATTGETLSLTRPLSGLYARRTVHLPSGVYRADEKLYGHNLNMVYSFQDSMTAYTAGGDYYQALIGELRIKPRNNGYSAFRTGHGTGTNTRREEGLAAIVANVILDGKDDASTDTLHINGTLVGVAPYLVAALGSGKINIDNYVSLQPNNFIATGTKIGKYYDLAPAFKLGTNSSLVDSAYLVFDTSMFKRNYWKAKTVIGDGAWSSSETLRVYGTALFDGLVKYNSNIAASYTARSLTDKNYVDSSVTANVKGFFSPNQTSTGATIHNASTNDFTLTGDGANTTQVERVVDAMTASHVQITGYISSLFHKEESVGSWQTSVSNLGAVMYGKDSVGGDEAEAVVLGNEIRLYQQSGIYKIMDIPDSSAAGTHYEVIYNPTDDRLYKRALGGGGGGGGSGTVNSGTANRLAYYASTGTTVDDLAAITANRALISDANGLPTHSSVTNTELGYVSGVTSAIQGQIDGKQKNIAYKRVFFVQAGATNVVTDGTNGVTTSGSISGITPTTASLLNAQRNIQFATGASAGSTTRCNNTSIEMTRGNAAGIGGFICVWRFANYALVDGNRAFFGLIDGVSALTNVDHRTNTAIARIGMYIDDDTGNWNIIHNTSGSAATSVDLGANFPINTTDLYELTLSCEPNSSTVSYYVSNLTTGNTTSGTLSSNLPAGSSFLAMHSWMNNNATAANCGFWLSKMYAEF